MSKLGLWIKRRIRACLHHLGYRIMHLRESDHLEPLLYAMLRVHPEKHFYVVQIGANDGQRFDPLHQFIAMNRGRITGLLVEPIKEYFDALVNTYRGYDAIVPVNVAIHNSKSKMTMYRVAPAAASRLPEFAKGIASFDADHHKRTAVPTDAIVAEEVNCVPLNELLQQNSVRAIDLLQIDTEGYDIEIVKGLDFNGVRPRIIRFEHSVTYGTTPVAALREILDLLRQGGYELIIERDDVIAYQRDLLIPGL